LGLVRGSVGRLAWPGSGEKGRKIKNNLTNLTHLAQSHGPTFAHPVLLKCGPGDCFLEIKMLELIHFPKNWFNGIEAPMENEDFEELRKAFLDRGGNATFIEYRNWLTRFISGKISRSASKHQREYDENDVASLAMKGLWDFMKQKPHVSLDNTRLWKKLCAIARNQWISLRRKRRALRRGGGEVRGQSVFVSNGNTDCTFQEQRQDFISGWSPELPDEVVMRNELPWEEWRERLMQKLPDDKTRSVARLYYGGYNASKIVKILKLKEQIQISETNVRLKIKIVEKAMEILRNE